MTTPATCPPREKLESLLQGRLADDESGQLEEHLLNCEDCQRATRVLNQTDTLAEAIREQALTPIPGVDEALLSGVMERLRDSSIVKTHVSSVDVTQIDGSGHREDDAAEHTFLRPAESQDELGRLGNFRVLRVIGRGGMGGVYLAEDLQLQRMVALKVMRPEFSIRKGAAERFLREARAAAGVKSEHVVTIYQVGQDQNIPFLAQELLEGETLDARLKREGRLPMSNVIEIGQEIAEGLAAAHAKGLIHRDIKPANAWLESDHRTSQLDNQVETRLLTHTSIGQSHDQPFESGITEAKSQGHVHVKLLDFGLARTVADTDHLTQSGMILGTPAYMAPEQARGDVVDERADLFSLGCVLSQCATGQRPFAGNEPMAILHSLATHTPAPVKTVRADAPAELSDLIEQLLAKDRDSRPKSAREVVRRLDSLAKPTSRATAEATASISRGRTEARPPLLQIILGITTTLVLLGVIVIKLKDKDGKEVNIKLDVPQGTKVVSVEQTPDETPAESAPQNPIDPAGTKNSTSSNTLSKLDPKLIPATERITDQPDELVAVIGEQRLRHWSGVSHIAFHPGGEFFVTRADSAQIWSTKTLEKMSSETPTAVWQKFAMPPSFAPDGRSIWSGQTSAAVEIDSSGKPKFRLTGERPLRKVRSNVSSVMSPDGRWLAVTGSPAGILEIWDLSKPTPRFFKEISFPAKNYSTALMLSQDGRRLMTNSSGATPSSDATLFLWDADWSASQGPVITAFGEPITAMHGSLSADGQRLVTYTSGKDIFQVLNLTQSPSQVEFEGKGHEPFAFSADGSWLVANSGGEIATYQRDQATWTKRFQLAPAKANVQAVAFSPDGKTLVIGDLSGYAHVWDLSADPPAERQPPPPASRVTHLAFSPDGRHLAVQGWDGGTVWSLEGETPRRLQFTEPTQNSICAPSFSADSGLVAFRGGVWNLGQTPPKKSLDRSQANIRLSSHAHTLVTMRGFNDLVSEQWEMLPRGDLRVVKTIQRWAPNRKSGSNASGRGGLIPLQFSSSRTVIDDGQGNVEVWNIADDKQPLHSVTFTKPSGYCLSTTGELLFVWDNTNGAVWNLKTDPPAETRFRLTGQGTQDASFTPDGQRIIAVDARGVVIYNWFHERAHQRLTFPGRVLAVALHPDGQHLATANGNGTVYILRLTKVIKSD